MIATTAKKRLLLCSGRMLRRKRRPKPMLVTYYLAYPKDEGVWVWC